MPELIDAVQYANYHYYSLPMTRLNLRVVQVPFPFKPLCLHTVDHVYEFNVRRSHGLLHALAVMELIDKIDETYLAHSVPGYQDALELLQSESKIKDKNQLMEYVKVAALFHDGARQGDGIDVWDAKSAINCMHYLTKEYGVNPELAQLLADAIEFKDNSKAFKNKYKEAWGDNIDFVRQLLNMADTLEVIRTRHVFKPEYLPIAAYVTPDVMVAKIIPDLVVPHRTKVIDEGRLSRAGRIEYDVDGHHFDDGAYKVESGYNLARMADTYVTKGKQYKTVVLHINEDNIKEVLNKALRGVQTYLDNYTDHAGVGLFHDGFFSPRYHGKAGELRALICASDLNAENEIQQRVGALYKLLSSDEGPTLKEAVLHSFDQYNVKTICSDLNKYMAENFFIDAQTAADDEGSTIFPGI
jgi:hypothetical protein